MPRFAFQVQRGKFSDAPIVEDDLEDHPAAWRAGLELCADLVREIVENLSPTDPEWVVAVKNDRGEILFRFRLSGEMPGGPSLPLAESEAGAPA